MTFSSQVVDFHLAQISGNRSSSSSNTITYSFEGKDPPFTKRWMAGTDLPSRVAFPGLR